MSRVFISYRRDDAKWQAREIYRALTQVLPREQVFMDVDSIPPGADFVDVLEGWVDQCDILLALIGATWVDAIDPKTGRRRLENPNDFVRIEVRKALARGIPVVPVLLDGAPIPDTERLPDDLQRLVRRNAELVEHRTVDTDVERLIRKLGLGQGRAGERPASQPPSAVRKQADAPATQSFAGRVGTGANDRTVQLSPGESIKDADFAPELVLVPPGKFWMGSKEGEGYDNERPRHEVSIGYPLLVGKYPVTFDEWDTFDRAEGIVQNKETNSGLIYKKTETRQEKYTPPDEGWGRGRRPVINVSWNDAKAYVAWLSKVTGRSYRLLSEAEWEYACRAGTTTAYSFGDTVAKSQAQFSEGKVGIAKQTVEVGSFSANTFGLHDMHGNVWEWCEDVWHENYQGAPTDGATWLADGDASRSVVRGGSWYFTPDILRSAIRSGLASVDRRSDIGLRLARTL